MQRFASTLKYALLILALGAATSQAADPMGAAGCPHDATGLTLPPGFCGTVFADGIGHARHLTVSNQGVVYVNTWSGRYFGKASGQCAIFADGFAGAAKAPGTATHRPSGLAVGPDGALYVSDDVGGRIYRIVYTGHGQSGNAGLPTIACPAAAAGAGPVAVNAAKPPEGTDPDAGAALPIPPGATADMVALGNRLFHGAEGGASCTGCHGGDGAGTPLGPSLKTGQYLWSDGGLAGIAATITQGVSQPKQFRAPMPAMRGAQLSQAQVAALASYVWVLEHPTPATTTATAPPVITIPGEKIYPESITSTTDGRILIGSIGARSIYRAVSGSAHADPWIAADSDRSLGVYGVLADEKSGTLWACFSTVPGSGVATPSRSALKAFDLQSGKFEARYELPADGALCNDIAVAPNGAVYVTDSNNMEIDRLQGRDQQLQLWAGDGDLGPKGGVLDGIAVLGNRVIAGTLKTGRLLSIPIGADGEPGTVTDLKVGRDLDRPDGIRTIGADQLMIVEAGGAGRLTRLTMTNDLASVTTIKEGFSDGPVSVAVVGFKAYVLEGQLSALFGSPDPGAAAKPFHAAAVDLPPR
jgi:mono/diheme cytochrome c family protein